MKNPLSKLISKQEAAPSSRWGNLSQAPSHQEIKPVLSTWTSQPPAGSQKEGTERLHWERMASPAPFFQEAFEILSCRTHQGLIADTPEPTQAEPTHPMPVFALSESCTNAYSQANGQTNSYDDCQTDSDTDPPETDADSLLSGCQWQSLVL